MGLAIELQEEISRNLKITILENRTQCPLAVDGLKKISQPCSLKIKVYALPKGQNEPKMKIFQLGIFA